MDIKDLTGQVEGFLITVRNIGQSFANWVNSFMSLKDSQGNIIEGTASLESLFINVNNWATEIADKVATWFKWIAVISIAFKAVSIAVALIGTGLALPILAVVALGLAIFGLWKYWDVISAKMSEIWEWAKTSILTLPQRMLDGLKSAAGAIFDVVTWPYRKAWDWVTGLFGGSSISVLGESFISGFDTPQYSNTMQTAVEKPFKDAKTDVKVGTTGGIGTDKSTKELGAILNTLVEQNRILNTIVRDGLPFNKGVT